MSTKAIDSGDHRFSMPTVDAYVVQAQDRWATDGGTLADDRRWTLSAAARPAVEGITS